MKYFFTLRAILRLTIVVVFGCLVLGRSNLEPGDQTERVRAFTRQIEFDYAGWMLDAMRIKLFATALGASNYLTGQERQASVLEYLQLVRKIQQTEALITLVYADPEVENPQLASQSLRQVLDSLKQRRDRLAPLAEAILQDQINQVSSDLALTAGGQSVPPVMYHSTPLPLALIVSPRNIIRQDEDISLIPDYPLDQQVELEERVDRALDVSSLVVNIGGVGVYPTMVQQTSNLEWLSEVVAHEWIHNYLTLRPLGANYMTTPELRIMNETAASIAGKEIGRAVMERFYPELLPPPAPAPTPGGAPPPPPPPPEFDFRKEMHDTRVKVDQMLAEGKIEEAEFYMETRRQVFWEHGYSGLRKINQAYFAFYGAYADEPVGPAGKDPVGAAVRALRAQSPTLAAFLQKIAWMDSFDDLQKAVGVANH